MSLVKIQSALKAPKGQTNSFGGYQYRNCEDILRAVKPLLADFGYHLILSDNIKEIGGRVYVEAVVTIWHDEKVIAQTSAFAREALIKKGMDESQITGAASSYARKYALNGLFAIDNTDDADAMDNRNHEIVDPIKHAAQEALTAAIARNEDSIDAVKTGIATEDYDLAFEAWHEVTNDDKSAMWVAPSKFDNAPFTTVERKAMQSTLWTEARHRYMGEER